MVEADPLGTSGGSEEHGGYGERRRRRQAPLGRVQGGKQRREWGPGEERGGAGGEGVSVASRGGRGGSRRWLGGEAGGGRGSVGERHASPLLVLLAEEEEDKGRGGGLGRLGNWASSGGCAGKAR